MERLGGALVDAMTRNVLEPLLSPADGSGNPRSGNPRSGGILDIPDETIVISEDDETVNMPLDMSLSESLLPDQAAGSDARRLNEVKNNDNQVNWWNMEWSVNSIGM